MKKDILEVIEKSLPAQVGETLQKRLAEADELEAQNKILTDCNKELKEDNAELEKRHNDLFKRVEFLAEREAAVSIREEKVTEREIKQDVEIVTLRRDEAVHRANEIKDLVAMVFKSPVYKRSYVENNVGTTDSNYDSATGQNTAFPTHIPDSKVIEETITEE